MAVEIRKRVCFTETVFHEFGPPVKMPLRRAACVAVIDNPFAGQYHEEIQWFMEELNPLGDDMATELAECLGGPGVVEGYGKGAIVGTDGELEHGALWHSPGGYAMRRILTDALAIVPSSKKVGTVGTALDIPITHIKASYVRSHFDSMEVAVTDAPRKNEIALILAMSTGARVHARAGGMSQAEISKLDGLR